MLVVLVLSVVSMRAVRIVGGSIVCLVWLAVTALMVVVSAVLTKWHGSD